MSVRNGDKARFGRLRKHRILLRKRAEKYGMEWAAKQQLHPVPRPSMTAHLRGHSSQWGRDSVLI